MCYKDVEELEVKVHAIRIQLYMELSGQVYAPTALSSGNEHPLPFVNDAQKAP
jgi:hypothetical protein